MGSYRKNTFCILLITGFAFGIISKLSGQGELQYEGLLNLGSYSAEADYRYDVIQEDTILNGPFYMQRFNLDALVSDGDSYFSLEGLFSYDMPDSTWRFRFGEFHADEGTELSDYHFKLTVSGVEHTAIANFNDGKPQGEWNHTVRRIDRSDIKNTIFRSNVRFEDGIPQGILRLENDSTTLLGRFLRNGFAHDTWVLNFDDEVDRLEKWYFVDGRLEKIVVERDQNLDTLMVYTNEIQRSKTVNMDNHFFQILGLQNFYDSTSYSRMGGKMAELISENATYYQRINNTLVSLDKLTKQVTMPIFSVEVAYYPLNNEESKELEMIKSNLQQIDTIGLALLNDTRLKLLKHSDEDILFLLSTVKQIVQDYVLPARKVVKYQKEGILDYFPRENLQSQLNLNPNPITEINVSFEDSSGSKTRTFEGPNPQLFDTNSTGFTYLAGLSKYAWACIDSIDRRLNKNLRNQKLQREMEELESKLISKAEHLTSLLDSLSKNLSKPYKSTLSAIKTTANSKLRAYSTEENLIVKPEQARELINCVENLEKLAVILSKLPDRRSEIEELYTEEVWNPFTATIMNDQVKEKITHAYDQLLIPSILDSIKTELTCSNTQEFQTMLDVLYQRMQELRKQNTSKLERKLKNEDDPEEVMKLFEVSM